MFSAVTAGSLQKGFVGFSQANATKPTHIRMSEFSANN
jgi:hypothetical protein